MKTKKVEVQVEGGLGNHLFQYAAGKYLAEKTGSQLVVDTSRIGLGMTNHGYYLNLLFQDFSAISYFARHGIIRNILSFRERLVSYISRHNSYLRTIIYKLFQVYFSDEIGFDKNIMNMNKPVALRGYFQTWKFANQLKFDGKIDPILLIKSPWFMEMESLAKDIKPVIIHVRRGDYRLMAEDFGLLSRDYYLDAMNLLPTHLKNREFWVFSNEIDCAIEMFQAETKYVFRFISPPFNSNPAESLMLMTLGDAHIIANSTFSYWGAFLSKNSELTIAPNKWFKLLEDPKDLLDPKWVRVESKWEEVNQ
ncbi:Fut1_Fut2_like domain containing protein [actinobacterium SCGC AAA044-D11]